MKPLGSVIVTIALLLTGLLGLTMSLCGGVVTFIGLNPNGMDILVISIPCLLLGLWLLRFAARRLRASRDENGGAES